jgi:hypothetical protein
MFVINLSLVVALHLRGGCDPKLATCDQPWSTPASNPSLDQLIISAGLKGGAQPSELLKSTGGAAGLFAGNDDSELQIPALEMPIFELPDYESLSVYEMPTFQGVAAQTADFPTLLNSVTNALPTRTTTTPPPFYTAKVDLTGIPMFTTSNMTLFQQFPTLSAVNQLANLPFFLALRQYIG